MQKASYLIGYVKKAVGWIRFAGSYLLTPGLEQALY